MNQKLQLTFYKSQGKSIFEKTFANIYTDNAIQSMTYGCKHIKVDMTTLDSCTCLSESDSKQYTNFEFYEGKICKHLKKHINLHIQAIYVDKNNLKRVCIFQKTMQVGVQVMILNKQLSKFCFKYDKIIFN